MSSSDSVDSENEYSTPKKKRYRRCLHYGMTTPKSRYHRWRSSLSKSTRTSDCGPNQDSPRFGSSSAMGPVTCVGSNDSLSPSCEVTANVCVQNILDNGSEQSGLLSQTEVTNCSSSSSCDTTTSESESDTESFECFSASETESSGCDSNISESETETPLFAKSTANEKLYDNCPLTQSSSYILIMLYVMKHGLSGEAFTDLLMLIFAHLPSTSNFDPSMYKVKETLKKRIGLKAPKIHKYCQECQQYLSENVCEKGACKEVAADVLEFYDLQLIDQLENMFADDVFLKLIMERQGKTVSGVSTEDITDICDGSMYKSRRSVMRSDESDLADVHLTFTMNTDGVSIFASSNKGSLWPVYLAINELPVKLRFTRKYLLLCCLHCQVEKPNMMTYLYPLMKTLQNLNNKASDCREWLIHYSAVVLLGLKPPEVHLHYLLLVTAMATLTKGKLTPDEISTAENQLKEFCRIFPFIYSENKQSMNIHMLKHLSSFTRMYGPLFNTSCFGFESMNCYVKSMIHGSRYVTSQVSFAVGMSRHITKHLLKLLQDHENDTVGKLVKRLGKKYMMWKYYIRRLEWLVIGLHPPVYLTLKHSGLGPVNCSIAVDNISLGLCYPGAKNLPENYYCTFDEGSSCGWHPGPYKSPLTWQLHHGPTPTYNTGPLNDHTTNTSKGYYMYVEADVEVPDGIEAKAELDSRIFLPPPQRSAHSIDENVHQTYNCAVTFAYHKYGFDAEKLHLMAVFPCSNRRPMKLWDDTMWDVNQWKMSRVSLKGINEPFRLRFTGVKRSNNRGDFALDDIAFSSECFGLPLQETHGHQNTEFSHTRQYYEDIDSIIRKWGLENRTEEQCNIIMAMLNNMIDIVRGDATETVVEEEGANISTYKFSNCGAQGQTGPSEEQCNVLDQYSQNPVRVRGGIQTWTVPKAGQYSITALGASGGYGARSVGESKGAFVHGKFNLSKGQQIHVLVGQQGWNGCSQIGYDDVKLICGGDTPSQNATQRIISGGGGGGGGATYVFLGDLDSDNLTPLLIAGGGGGLGYNITKPDQMVQGGWAEMGSGRNGYTYPNGAGGGGGWNGQEGQKSSDQSGQGILQSPHPGRGGAPCPAARDQGWNSGGGFGGGGGGCFTGGGGGGYTGGNASHESNELGLINGMGGTSYIAPDAVDAEVARGIRQGHGTVEFHLKISCPCAFLCVVISVEKKLYECHCPVNKTLAHDRHNCIDRVVDSGMDVGHIIIICAGVLFILLLLTSVTCIVQFRRRKHTRPVLRDMPPLSLASDNDPFQSQRPLGRRTEVNLVYDFVGTDMVTQDLTQIPRDSVRLIRPLGQGAFGEVYEGILSNFSQDKCNMPVAVKTLPAISTDQAKLDFLMEAVIISKFQHPNIVKFIGICMDKHPGFIILELLEGGDLKTFLRESRKKADVPCPLTVPDLLRLALDVAKGCKHLEQDHFIHRDIAARNCLLTTKGPNRMAKIADFGMARDIYRADYYKKGGRAMLPVKWMPPEAFMDGIFTTKTDVWSFGVLLWEVFSMGLMPYPGRSNQDVMEYVTAGGRMNAPNKCPPLVYDIMASCWHVVPERRPSFPGLIKKLVSCLQNDEVINAPVASNPLGLGSDQAFSLSAASPSSTTPLLSPKIPDPPPDPRMQLPEHVESKSQEHKTAFSKLHPQGYRPLPQQDGTETTAAHQPLNRERLSFDFTNNYNMVPLIPPSVSSSSPNIVTTTDLSDLCSHSDTEVTTLETGLLHQQEDTNC